MRRKKSKTQETGAVKRKRRRKASKAGKGTKVTPKRAGAPGGAGERGKRGESKFSTAGTGGGESEGRRIKFPVFESLGQAAAVLRAPLALIKAAKRQGCSAFISGSRVDSGILVPFLFGMMTKGSELPEGMASPQEWLTTEKAKREAIRRKNDEHTMMPSAEAARQASEAASYIFAELERGERELPPALAGGTAIDIFKRLHSFIEALRKTGKEKFEAIGRGQ
jgi:hypothetical protein